MSFTPLGIYVALVFIGLPFVVRTVQPVLIDLDTELEEAAATLGATRWQTITRVATDEIEDPRIWAELLRQFTTLHPEFSFLPRKFKIAVTAAAHDRAAVRVHDIGLRLHRNGAGETGFEVIVGGGLGRTPFIGKTIKPFLPKRDLLSWRSPVQPHCNSPLCGVSIPVGDSCGLSFPGLTAGYGRTSEASGR